MPETFKEQLLINKLIDRFLFDCHQVDEDRLLKRFIDERVVSFRGRSVLAPIWELVNHSSFAFPLRVTLQGVETPCFEPTSKELLHKYSQKNSPMGMWKKYGFACRCIVAYSLPFKINFGNNSQSVSCSGILGLGPKEKRNIICSQDSISIKSLPIGCLSPDLPFANFCSDLRSAGLSEDLSRRLFPKVLEFNKAYSGPKIRGVT